MSAQVFPHSLWQTHGEHSLWNLKSLALSVHLLVFPHCAVLSCFIPEGHLLCTQFARSSP